MAVFQSDRVANAMIASGIITSFLQDFCQLHTKTSLKSTQSCVIWSRTLSINPDSEFGKLSFACPRNKPGFSFYKWKSFDLQRLQTAIASVLYPAGSTTLPVVRTSLNIRNLFSNKSQASIIFATPISEELDKKDNLMKRGPIQNLIGPRVGHL